MMIRHIFPKSDKEMFGQSSLEGSSNKTKIYYLCENLSNLVSEALKQ